MDPFTHRDHAAAVLAVDAIHVGQEVLGVEVPLRAVDQVRAIIRVGSAQGAGRGEEASVAPHDHGDVDPGQGAVIQVGAHKGQGNEAGRRGEARGVVVEDQVVVDGLGHMDAPEVVTCRVGLGVDDTRGVRAVVAADIEEVAHVMRLEHLEDALAILLIRLVPGAQDARGRGAGHPLQVVGCLLGQVHELFVDDALDAVDSAINPGDLRELACLHDDAHQGLVDHRGRPATLSDHNLPFKLAHLFLRKISKDETL